MPPHLRILDVRMLSPGDCEALEGYMDPRWIHKLRNVKKVDPLAMVTTFIQQGRLIEKSAKDKVVVVQIVNEGKNCGAPNDQLGLPGCIGKLLASIALYRFVGDEMGVYSITVSDPAT